MNSDTGTFRTIILAAGKGTRMKSDVAKVLHPLCDRPMLSYVIESARQTGSEAIYIIVGYQAEAVKNLYRHQDLVFIEQPEQLGTGHAVLQARDQLEGYNGTVLILCGDVPLIKPSTLRSLLARHRATGSVLTVLTTMLPDPTGYGRIVKGKDGSVKRVVEERDATEAERRIHEINTGIYCAERKFLFEALMSITNDNTQKEYYLTDIVALAGNEGGCVTSEPAVGHREVMGINSQDDLDKACSYLAATAEHGEPP